MPEVNPNDPSPEGAAKPEQDQKESINLSTWFKRIEASERYMKEKFRPKYELAKKRLRSELVKKTQKGGHPAHEQVNLVYSIGVNFVNSVAFKAPNADLKARDEAEHEKVENTEIKINDFLKDKKVKKTIKRTIWDAFLGGFGAVFLGYNYQDYETEEPATDDLGNPILKDSMDETGNPTQTPVNRRAKIVNAPSVDRIRPDLLRFPRGFDFDNYQDSSWIGFDVLQPVEEVKLNPDFDKEATAEIKGSLYQSLSQENDRYDKQESTDDLLWARLHYIFERPKMPNETMKLLVLCSENKDKPLQYSTHNKGNVGYPIKPIYFNPLDDDCAYPDGDPWIWESQLSAIDRWWKTMLNHVKRVNPKIVYDKGKITPTEIQKMKSSDDLEYAAVDPKGQSLEAAFYQFQHSPVHQDVHTFYETAKQILSELSPKSGLGRGNADASTGTATGDKIIQANEFIDIEARIDDIREFWIEIIKDLAGIFENNFQGTAMIKGTLDDGTEIEREIDRSGFTSQVNADIDVETMQAPNKEIFRRQLIDAVATLRAFVPDLAKKKKAIDGEFFAKKVMETFNIRNIDKAIIPLEIRDPSREESDFVFKKMPFVVQEGEDFEDHLRIHQDTLSDPLKMQIFEQLMPGFGEGLNNHILETAETKKRMEKPQPKMPQTVKGARDPMATEIARA